MNCESVLHQIEVAVKTLIKIVSQLEEADLRKRPTLHKQSIGELLEHIAIICEADWRIANEATQDEMETFYANVSYKTVKLIEKGLMTNFHSFYPFVNNLTDSIMSLFFR